MTTRTTYVSSKLRHRNMWLSSGIPTISSWIHGEELPPDECSDMWDRYRSELTQCDSFVLYAEPEDQLKGCMIELGLAVAFCENNIVVWAGSIEALVAKVGTIAYHRTVTVVRSIEEAKALLL